jgi:guanidinoacetate N-methyltransferase
VNPGQHVETERAQPAAAPASHPSVLVDQGALDEQRRRDELQGMYGEVGFHPRQDWKTAPAVFDGHSLRIMDHPVMEDWEDPYMAKLAEIATRAARPRLATLEIGFGLGLSAGHICRNQRVERHTIIEANHDVAERARAFAGGFEGRVTVLEGLWEEVIDQIPDGSCDGILFDAYPLDESEVQNQVHFAGTAYRKLRAGGYFTYFSDEATGFRPEHLKALVAAGFSEQDISHEIVAVTPPPDCQYWKSDTIMAPIVVRRA